MPCSEQRLILYFFKRVSSKYHEYKLEDGGLFGFIKFIANLIRREGTLATIKRFINNFQSNNYSLWIKRQKDRLKHLEKNKAITAKLRLESKKKTNVINAALIQDVDEDDWLLIIDEHVTEIEFSDQLYGIAVQENPNADIIYFDHDYIDVEGGRSTPYFKPNWNYELFLSNQYVSSHYLIKVKVFRHLLQANLKQFPRSSDEFLIRYLELYKNRKISHFADVAYSLPIGSLGYKKDYSELKAYIIKNTKVSFIEEGSNGLKLTYPLPSLEHPMVTILIPTRDMLDVTKRCINSVINLTTYSNYQICIIDNASVEHETLSYFASVSRNERVYVVRYDHEFNYSAINNFGVNFSKGELVCLLNNDVEVISPGWLEELVSHAIRPDVGCVGGMLLYPDNKVQHAGVLCGVGNVAAHAHRFFNVKDPGYFGQLQVAQEVCAVTAACLVVKKSIYNEVGGLNEVDLRVAYNDVDFCLKVNRAGYHNIYTPHAKLYHYESLSRGSDILTKTKRERYESERDYMWKAWGKELENDYYYNKHLSKLKEDYSFQIIS